MNDAFQPFTASNPENESINLWSISRHRPTHLESGTVKFKYKFNKGYFAFQKSLFFSLVCLNLKMSPKFGRVNQKVYKIANLKLISLKKLLLIHKIEIILNCTVKVCWLLGNYPRRKNWLYIDGPKFRLYWHSGRLSNESRIVRKLLDVFGFYG